MQKPRVHGDACAVVGYAGLIVLVDEVLVEQVEVLVSCFLAVQFLNLVAQHLAVQADEVLLWKFADKCCNVLLFYICVSIELTAGSSVLSFAVVEQEVELALYFAVFEVLLAIQDIRFCCIIVAFSHKSDFNLVLDFLDTNSIIDVYAT